MEALMPCHRDVEAGKLQRRIQKLQGDVARDHSSKFTGHGTDEVRRSDDRRNKKEAVHAKSDTSLHARTRQDLLDSRNVLHSLGTSNHMRDLAQLLA